MKEEEVDEEREKVGALNRCACCVTIYPAALRPKLPFI